MWLSPPTPFRSGLAWRFSRVFFENRSAKTICSSSIILTDPLGVVLGMPSDEAVATHAILPFRNSCTSFGIFAIWFFFLFVALLSGSGFHQLFQKCRREPWPTSHVTESVFGDCGQPPALMIQATPSFF